MNAIAFADPWDGLQIYDTEWRLISTAKVLENMARYEAQCVELGTLPAGPLAAPLKVTFELTRRCNLRCTFCYNDSGPGLRSFGDEEALDIARQLCDLHVLEVVLTGGEVLVVPQRLSAVLDILSARGAGVHVITNGWHMTPSWARSFADHGVLSVQVSIDGADPSIHDDMRGRRGSWRRAVDAVGMLKRAGCYVAMAAVATSRNVRTIEDYVDFAYCLGADHVLVGDVTARGRAARSHGELRVSDRAYVDLLEILRSKAEQYRSQMLIHIGTDEALSLKMQLQKRPEGFLIRGDGSVTPGCLLPVPLGDARDRPLAEIWCEEFADLAAHESVLTFLKDLRVSAIGPQKLMRVVHEDTPIGTEV